MATIRRKPTRAETGFLLLFHAVLSGSFLIAYLTGDEDTYGMHLVAGYTVLAALGARLVVAFLAPVGSPLRLPRPSSVAARIWLGRLVADRRPPAARSPLYAWFAMAMLLFVSIVAASGWLADSLSGVEDFHEAAAELTPLIIVLHIVTVVLLSWLRRASRPAAPETAAVSAG